MILAAGRGTRLAPLTDTVPKALVEVAGITMLERVARRLIDAGAARLIVNTHHHAEQVRLFLERKEFFGVEVCISDESDLLLDTGGGLKNAAPCFRREAPFVLHNVDVLCDADLGTMYRASSTSNALAHLAVMDREANRYLLFDDNGLCGHGNASAGTEKLARPIVGEGLRLGFAGIHVIDPRIFDLITETGVFSIIPLYMRLVAQGERILPHRIDDVRWLDIGTPEKLAHADRAWD